VGWAAQAGDGDDDAWPADFGTLKMRRARGSGSYPLVKWVSAPLASNTNGSRPSTVTDLSCASADRTVAYIADCHSTPDRVVPSGLASMTPTTFLSTQQVVGAAVTRLHHDLAAGDTVGGEQVEALLVLHHPARLG